MEARGGKIRPYKIRFTLDDALFVGLVALDLHPQGP